MRMYKYQEIFLEITNKNIFYTLQILKIILALQSVLKIAMINCREIQRYISIQKMPKNQWAF